MIQQIYHYNPGANMTHAALVTFLDDLTLTSHTEFTL